MSATVHPITDDVEALSTVPKDDVEAKNVLDDDFLKKVDLGAAKLNLGDVRSALRSKCKENPQLMAVAKDAWTAFGMSNLIANVKKDAKDVVNAGKEQAIGLLKEKGEEAKKKGEEWLEEQAPEEVAEILKTFMSIAGPFLAQGAAALNKKHKKDPLAYNVERGKQLHKEIPQWKWAMGPFYLLRPAQSDKSMGIGSTIFLFVTFCVNLWALAIYNLFTDEATGYCCQWMLPIWNSPDSNTDALTQMLGFFAVLMVPFVFVGIEKVAMNTATLPVCGALVAKLEEHYAPEVDEPWGGERSFKKKTKEMKLWHTFNSLNKRPTRALWICGFLLPLGVGAVVYQYIINKFIVHHHVAAIIECVLTIVCLGVAMPAVVATAILLSSICSLIKHNILAYRELLELLSLQVTLVYERKLAAVPKGTTDPDEMARAQTRIDPLVMTLQRQVQKREQFLVAVSKAVIKGEVRDLVNSAYTFVLAFYFFQLFSVGITFIKLRLGGTVSTAEIFFSIGIVVFMLILIFPITTPLVAMSSQAQAWVSLTKSLTSRAATKVSLILSPKKSPHELHKHHIELQDNFTWSICGLSMSYASIGKAIATYLGALWVAIFLPAISDYQEQLKNEMMARLNQTVAQVSAAVSL